MRGKGTVLEARIRLSKQYYVHKIIPLFGSKSKSFPRWGHITQTLPPKREQKVGGGTGADESLGFEVPERNKKTKLDHNDGNWETLHMSQCQLEKMQPFKTSPLNQVVYCDGSYNG